MAKLRKQYHFRWVGQDRHIWDVHRLIRLSHGYKPMRLPLDSIAELDENWWFDMPGQIPTPRAIAAHMALVQAADLSFPILLCADGRLMDGMHRLTRAILENHRDILAIRLPQTPLPDFINRSEDDLPYPDEEV